jgi:hypothetical protein
MVDRLLVVIQADDIGELRATGRRHAAEMPEPEDNDFHARFSKTQVFALNQSSVFKTAS